MKTIEQLEQQLEALAADIAAIKEAQVEPAQIWEPDWDSAPEDSVACTVDSDGEIMWLHPSAYNSDYNGWERPRNNEYVPMRLMGDWRKMFFVRPDLLAAGEPEIDWDAVEYDWVTVDKDGKLYQYEDKPEKRRVAWDSDKYYKKLHPRHVSHAYLSLPWRETLRKRPE